MNFILDQNIQYIGQHFWQDPFQNNVESNRKHLMFQLRPYLEKVWSVGECAEEDGKLDWTLWKVNLPQLETALKG